MWYITNKNCRSLSEDKYMVLDGSLSGLASAMVMILADCNLVTQGKSFLQQKSSSEEIHNVQKPILDTKWRPMKNLAEG